jgi:hypothetical protein
VVDGYVWTTTHGNGTLNGGLSEYACYNWTSSAGTNPPGGVVGNNAIVTDGEWTDYSVYACSNQEHLYCFQQ